MRILYEDNHLIAVEKKSGQPVQPEPGKPESLQQSVLEMIRRRDQKPGNVFVGVIHRLDMPVTGIVLFAKTSKALTRMNDIFRKREVEKIYEARVENQPPKQEDLLTHWLKRDEKKNLTRAYAREIPEAEKAQLIYKLTQTQSGKSVLRIKLLTGRKHQIRAQLAAIGCPIVGDVKYGASGPLADSSIALSAVELRFVHPVKKVPILIQI